MKKRQLGVITLSKLPQSSLEVQQHLVVLLQPVFDGARPVRLRALRFFRGSDQLDLSLGILRCQRLTGVKLMDLVR